MVEATGRKGGKLYASQRQTTMGVTLKAVPRPLRKWQSTKVAGVDRYRQIIRRMNLKDIVQAHAKNIQKLSALNLRLRTFFCSNACLRVLWCFLRAFFGICALLRDLRTFRMKLLW